MRREFVDTYIREHRKPSTDKYLSGIYDSNLSLRSEKTYAQVKCRTSLELN